MPRPRRALDELLDVDLRRRSTVAQRASRRRSQRSRSRRGSSLGREIAERVERDAVAAGRDARGEDVEPVGREDARDHREETRRGRASRPRARRSRAPGSRVQCVDDGRRSPASSSRDAARSTSSRVLDEHLLGRRRGSSCPASSRRAGSSAGARVGRPPSPGRVPHAVGARRPVLGHELAALEELARADVELGDEHAAPVVPHAGRRRARMSA